MTSQMSFWALPLLGKGKEVKQEIVQNEREVTYIHVTNLALGKDPAPGTHTVAIIHRGVETVLATLEKGVCYQHSLDFVIDETCSFKNYGASSVQIMGYQTTSTFDSEDLSGDMMYDEEDDSEDEPPLGVPITGAPQANGKPARPQAPAKPAAKPPPRKDEDSEDESDEGDEDEDEDEDMGGDGYPALGSDDVVGVMGEDDSDEGESDEGEDEYESEDEDEEDEEDTPPTKAAKPGDKRGGAMTPAPAAKKSKGHDGAPATAPPKVSQAKLPHQKEQKGQQQQQKQGKQPVGGKAAGGKEQKQQPAQKKAPGPMPKGQVAPGDAAGFEKALVDHIKSVGGTQNLAKLGSFIKKPAAVAMKYTQFIKSKPDVFKVDDKTQTVALAKK